VITALALPAGVALLTVGDIPFAPGLGLGLAAVFLAILADIYSRAVINAVRFKSDRWRAVSRAAADRDVGSD
jgi:Na+-driven multidrug efflux pump